MLVKENIKDIYQLSPMQEGMYFHYLMDRNAAAYFEQISYRMDGALEIGLVKESLLELVKRHDVLRTVFNHEKASVPLQVVLKDVEFDFVFEDIRGLGDDERREAYVSEYKRKDKERLFNLNKELLMRVAVLQTGSRQYEFIWSHHHIILDGWSISILIAEYGAIYESLSGRRPLALKAPKGYRAYVDWVHSRDKLRSKEFWQQYLDGYDTLSSPRGDAHNAGGAYQGRKKVLRMGSRRSAQLQQLAVESGVSLNIVMQTIWAVLLGKYCRTRDVVFGAITSGRPPELGDVLAMVGLFINSVPVRIRWSAGQRFSELLAVVQDEYLTCEPYHYYSLAEIQAATHLKQGLLDHLFVFENYPLPETAQSRSSADAAPAPSVAVAKQEIFEQTNYDLNVIVGGRNEVIIDFNYNSNAYSERYIDDLAAHLVAIIAQVTEDPAAVVDGIQLLDEAGGRKLLEALTPPPVAWPRDKTITAIFSEAALLYPDNIAVRAGGRSLSYRELHEMSDKLAAYLRRSAHVKEQDRVAILMDRSEWQIIAILGILKCAAVYVPVDTAYPAARIDFMLRDASVKLVLTSGQELGSPAPDGCAVLPVAGRWTDISTAGNDIPVSSGSASDLAYIIYTSGSTGMPKGVMVAHRNVVNLMKAEGRQLSFSANDTWVLFHAVSFDFSVWEIWGALLNGGTLVLPDADTCRNPESFAALLAEERVTVLNQVPTMFYQVKEILSNREQPLALQLRYVIFGGEELNPAKLSGWYDLYPTAKLVNMYGITETTVHVTYKEIGEKEIAAGESNIGAPLPNVQVYIMDESHHLLPDGIMGEIVVGGEGVAAGYLNRPELDSERFISDPYTAGRKLYCSGDLGVRVNGEIIYKGRMDNQVKVRGYRIEPGEIGHAIEKLPGIRRAVVVSQPAGGDAILAAYFVGDASRRTDQDFRQELAKTLPAYMIPSRFIRVQELPRTQNGKVDRAAFAAAAAPDAGSGLAYEGPANEVEAKLVSIWESVLDRSGIGVTDDFFAIGGHSLIAIRVVNRIMVELKVRMALRDVFVYTTVREMAKRIADVSAAKLPLQEALYRTDAPRDMPGGNDSDHEASLRQEEDWHYNYNVRKQQPPNVMKFSLDLTDIDVEAFSRAYSYLVQRHESLRTRFPKVNGRIVQRIEAYDEGRFGLMRLQAAYDHAEAVISKLSRDILFGMKDIKNGPLVKGVLVNVGGDRHVFIFFIHHIISDYWSLNILKDELKALYFACKEGQEPALPQHVQQLREYTARQNRQLRSGDENGQQYWRRRLSDLAWHVDYDIIYNKLRPGFPEHEQAAVFGAFSGWKDISAMELIRDPVGEQYTVYLDPLLFSRLTECRKRIKCSTYSILLAGFNLLCLKLANNDNVLIQSHYSNRHEEGAESVIGNLLGKSLLYSNVDRNLTIEEFIIRGYSIFDESISRLVFSSESMNALKLTTRSFLFFNFIDLEMTGEREIAVEAPSHQPDKWVESPLVCEASEYVNTIVFKWFFSSRFFNIALMKCIAEEYRFLLDQIVMCTNEKIRFVL